jgi:hypothetical protein
MKITYTIIAALLLGNISIAQKFELSSKQQTRVTQAGKTNFTSTQALVKFLVDTDTGDFNKAKLIYAYIATHTNYGGTFPAFKNKEEAAQFTFKTKTAVCSGYSALFNNMAKVANLKSIAIVGKARGNEIKAFQPVPNNNHEWNLVWWQNKWHIIDATWGNTSRLPYINQLFNPYYFDVAPTEIIYSHYSTDSTWTKMVKNLELNQFNNQPTTFHNFYSSSLNRSKLKIEKTKKQIVISFSGKDLAKEQIMVWKRNPAGSIVTKLSPQLKLTNSETGTLTLDIQAETYYSLLIAQPQPNGTNLFLQILDVQ